MRNYFFYITVLLILSLTSAQCTQKKTKRKIPISKETLINVNKKLVDQDAERIKLFLQEKNIQMTQTKTGLWYSIDKNIGGEQIGNGSVVKYNYSIELLDGTLCYSSDSLGAKTITIGKSSEESGINEGIQLLSKNDEASFLIPPHLAHGLMGDDDKIPARSILYVHVEVLDVK